MRHRRTVIAASVAAVLAVAATIALMSVAGRDRTPTPAASGPVAVPSATASGVPSPTATPSASTTPTPSVQPPRPTRPPGLPAGLLGRDIEVIPTTQQIVALTFDAGANADGLPSILKTLATQQVTGTFFLTGSFAANHPGSVRAITAAGHRIGNHTATHPHSRTLSNAALRTQLATAEHQLQAAGASDPRPLFRFPYGERDARTIAVVNTAGYVAVRWTVDSLGWQGRIGRTDQQATQLVTDRVLGAARPGEIVLMHVGSHPQDHTTLDAAALPTVIDRLRARGYRFVSLDALLT